jgi:CheY-like chemotaxis protein
LTAPPSLAEREPATREPIPFPGRPGVGPASGSTPAPLASLGTEHIEPLDAPSPVAEPVQAIEPVAPVAPANPPEAPADVVARTPDTGARDISTATPASDAFTQRRALVAEDSIAARIYLVRLLEQQGYAVHAVATATALRAALTEGPWALVFADGGLPDVRTGDLLGELARTAEAAGAAMVALVRDADDESAARAAGVMMTLRKPFDREGLEHLLGRIAPETSPSSGGAPGALGHESDPREWGAR